MTIKDIAAAFDMSIDGFAALIGYTRQALYAGKISNIGRAFAALEKLAAYNEAAYNIEMARVSARRDQREAAIKAFEEQFMKRDKHER